MAVVLDNMGVAAHHHRPIDRQPAANDELLDDSIVREDVALMGDDNSSDEDDDDTLSMNSCGNSDSSRSDENEGSTISDEEEGSTFSDENEGSAFSDPMDFYLTDAASTVDMLVFRLLDGLPCYRDVDDDVLDHASLHLTPCSLNCSATGFTPRRKVRYNWLDLARVTSAAKKNTRITRLVLTFGDSGGKRPTQHDIRLWSALCNLPNVNEIVIKLEWDDDIEVHLHHHGPVDLVDYFEDFGEYYGPVQLDYYGPSFFIKRYSDQLRHLTVNSPTMMQWMRDVVVFRNVVGHFVPALSALSCVECIHLSGVLYSSVENWYVYTTLSLLKTLKKLVVGQIPRAFWLSGYMRPHDVMNHYELLHQDSQEALGYISTLTSLEFLELSSLEIKAEWLGDFVRQNVLLDELELNACQIRGRKGVMSLAGAISSHSSLKTFTSRYSMFPVCHFWELFGRGLAGNSSSLQALHIVLDGSIAGGTTQDTFEGKAVTGLLQGIAQNESLLDLKLYMPRSPLTKSPLLSALRGALKSHKSLKKVTLAASTVSSLGFSVISKALSRQQSSISGLTIIVYNGGIRGFGSIVQAANTCTSLESIHIYGRTPYKSFMDEFEAALYDLAGNTSLQALHIAPSFDDDTHDGLIDAKVHLMMRSIFGMTKLVLGTGGIAIGGEAKLVCELNNAGRRYLIQNPCKEAGVDVLSKVSDSLDQVFYHLRENPSLCSLEHGENEEMRRHGSNSLRQSSKGGDMNDSIEKSRKRQKS